MRKPAYYIVNGITWYRIMASLFLFLLISFNQKELFKWFLAISFFTDLIDGTLARKYKVTTESGAKIDSIGDDLTIAAAMLGVFVFDREFAEKQATIFLILLTLFVTQVVIAVIRFKRMTSFHTYAAKIAAILQEFFFILFFFLSSPPYLLFYLAAAVTGIGLAEEIMITVIIPEWKTNVKGIYWVLKKEKVENQ